MTQGDQLLRAHSMPISLRDNLPNNNYINEKWAGEYNRAVDKVESAVGMDLQEFKLPSSELQRVPSSGNYLTKEVTYRDGLWCERSFLMQRFGSILIYFTGLQSDNQRQIGFRAPS